MIADFVIGEDRIELDDTFFAETGSTGQLSPGAFAANATGVAVAADDRLIYNNTDGRLMYDADGSSTTYAAVHFATLSGVPEISASDIYVI